MRVCVCVCVCVMRTQCVVCPQCAMDAGGARRIFRLLCLSLFVSLATADCPKPREWGTIVVTDEVLVTKDFPEGAVAKVQCSNGYIKVNGSATTTCVNGEWTQPDLLCTRKDCGPPRPRPHMIFDISGGTLLGDFVQVSCEKGYRLSGASQRQCFAGGWSRKSECNIATCDAPSPVDNGTHSWVSAERPQYGDVVNYTCADGFVRSGPANIACGVAGWDPPNPPTCTEVRCQIPAVPSGGKHSWDSAEMPGYGDVVHFECDDGLKLVGRSSITCGASGYDGQPPQCTEASTIAPTPTPTDKPITTIAAPTVTTPTQATTVATPTQEGAGDNLTAEDEAEAANGPTQTSMGDKLVVVDTSPSGYTTVAISVVCVAIGMCILVFIIHKYMQRKKGSYNTREDQKHLHPSTTYRMAAFQSNGTLNQQENMVV